MEVETISKNKAEVIQGSESEEVSEEMSEVSICGEEVHQ